MFALHASRIENRMRHALLLLATMATSAGAQATDLTPVVDRVFNDWSTTTPGCAVGVSQQGRTLFTKGYGMANLETGTPNTAETIFESGSVAKQFTATAVLLLMHDGKLRMDDPVQKFIPELPTYDRPITLRHLISHTSGLREWSNLVAVAGWPRGTRAHTQEDLLGYVLAQRSLNYPVGDYYSYTNSGFALLQTVVERVSGMPFARFSDERIFKPLGMTNTAWRDDFNRVVPGGRRPTNDAARRGCSTCHSSTSSDRVACSPPLPTGSPGTMPLTGRHSAPGSSTRSSRRPR